MVSSSRSADSSVVLSPLCLTKGSALYWKTKFEMAQSIIKEANQNPVRLGEILGLLPITKIKPKEEKRRKSNCQSRSKIKKGCILQMQRKLCGRSSCRTDGQHLQMILPATKLTSCKSKKRKIALNYDTDGEN